MDAARKLRTPGQVVDVLEEIVADSLGARGIPVAHARSLLHACQLALQAHPALDARAHAVAEREALAARQAAFTPERRAREEALYQARLAQFRRVRGGP